MSASTTSLNVSKGNMQREIVINEYLVDVKSIIKDVDVTFVNFPLTINKRLRIVMKDAYTMEYTVNVGHCQIKSDLESQLNPLYMFYYIELSD